MYVQLLDCFYLKSYLKALVKGVDNIFILWKHICITFVF